MGWMNQAFTQIRAHVWKFHLTAKKRDTIDYDKGDDDEYYDDYMVVIKKGCDEDCKKDWSEEKSWSESFFQ